MRRRKNCASEIIKLLSDDNKPEVRTGTRKVMQEKLIDFTDFQRFPSTVKENKEYLTDLNKIEFFALQDLDFREIGLHIKDYDFVDNIAIFVPSEGKFNNILINIPDPPQIGSKETEELVDLAMNILNNLLTWKEILKDHVFCRLAGSLRQMELFSYLEVD
jgi:hypothetical protein